MAPLATISCQVLKRQRQITAPRKPKNIPSPLALPPTLEGGTGLGIIYFSGSYLKKGRGACCPISASAIGATAFLSFSTPERSGAKQSQWVQRYSGTAGETQAHCKYMWRHVYSRMCNPSSPKVNSVFCFSQQSNNDVIN